MMRLNATKKLSQLSVIVDGSITSDTTVGSVANQVDAGAKTMAHDAAEAVGTLQALVPQDDSAPRVKIDLPKPED